MFICHPEYRCRDDCDSPLYHAADGDLYALGNIGIVHACEHLIHQWWPDSPADLAADEAMMQRAYYSNPAYRAIYPHCDLAPMLNPLTTPGRKNIDPETMRDIARDLAPLIGDDLAAAWLADARPDGEQP